MSKKAILIGFSTFFLAAATSGTAQESERQPAPGLLSAGGYLDDPNPDVVFAVGAGASVSPAYPGSGDFNLGPSGAFRFDFVRFPNGFTFGSSRAVGFREGFQLQGAGRIVRARNSDDYSEIAGLEDVDWTLELGVGVGYEQRNYRFFGNARYGFFGHESFVGQIGGDFVMRPMKGLTINFGPRVDFGESKYVNTYFGVTPAGSAASGLSVYSADGGIVSAGLELNTLYQLNPRWGVEGRIKWNRLLNGAADSPITQLGSENQFSIQVNLVRRLSINF